MGANQHGWSEEAAIAGGQGAGAGGGGGGGSRVSSKTEGWALLRSFCDHSSLIGLKYLAERRRPWPERIVWLAGLLLALAACSVLVMQTWRRWRTSTVILQRSVTDLPFPAVTVCPDIKFDAKRIGLDDVLARYRKNNITQEEIDMIEDLALVCPLAAMPRSFQKLSTTRPGTAVDTIENYALKLDYYISNAYLLLQFRHPTNIFHPIMTEEGLCYSFNTLPGKYIFEDNTFHASRKYLKMSKNKRRVQWKPGSAYDSDADAYPVPFRAIGIGRKSSFVVVLNELPLNETNHCGNSNGFQVMVHSPGEIPRPSQHAVHVPRGAAVDVAVRPAAVWTDDRVRDAYAPEERQCFYQEERALRYFRVYTQGNCELECLANYTLRLCGCVDFYMPRRMQRHQAGLKAGPGDEIGGLSLKMSEEEGQRMQCNCLQECNHIEYKMQVSYRPALPSIRNGYFRFPPMLTVYLEDSYYNPMRRIEIFGTIEFIANCGGLLGLCLGFSVLSVVEILYWLLVRPWCQRRTYRARPAPGNGAAADAAGPQATPRAFSLFTPH